MLPLILISVAEPLQWANTHNSCTMTLFDLNGAKPDMWGQNDCCEKVFYWLHLLTTPTRRPREKKRRKSLTFTFQTAGAAHFITLKQITELIPNSNFTWMSVSIIFTIWAVKLWMSPFGGKPSTIKLTSNRWLYSPTHTHTSLLFQTAVQTTEQTELVAAVGAESQLDLCLILQCVCGVAAITHG